MLLLTQFGCKKQQQLCTTTTVIATAIDNKRNDNNDNLTIQFVLISQCALTVCEAVCQSAFVNPYITYTPLWHNAASRCRLPCRAVNHSSAYCCCQFTNNSIVTLCTLCSNHCAATHPPTHHLDSLCVYHPVATSNVAFAVLQTF